MTATSEQLPLPFSLFPSSSLIDSKIRPIHSTECSLRPQESHIKLKEEWWGPLGAGSDRSLESNVERGEETRESRETKRRRTETREDDIVSSKKGKEDDRETRRSRTEQEDFENVANSESSSRRRRRESSHQAHSRRDERRCTQSAKSQASRSRSPLRSRHSRNSPAPLQRSPSPCPLRSASSVLHKPLRDLQQSILPSDYDDYLTRELVDPLYSFNYQREQIEFYCTSSAAVNWSQRPQSGVFNRVRFFPLNGQLLEIQPNLEKIRKEFPLESLGLDLPAQDRMARLWSQMLEVLKWIYGREVRMAEVYWFVENAPPPLLVLVRLHADTIRYSVGVSPAAIDFRSYLLSNPIASLTQPEKRARELLRWLSDDVTQDKLRWKNWWIEVVERDREGKRVQWKEWLDEAEGWRTDNDLEKWENGRKAQGKWWMR